MNYRHEFHAGNFADVFKHAVLCRILWYLRGKPAAFRVIDTHECAVIGAFPAIGELRENDERFLPPARVRKRMAAVSRVTIAVRARKAASRTRISAASQRLFPLRAEQADSHFDRTASLPKFFTMRRRIARAVFA